MKISHAFLFSLGAALALSPVAARADRHDDRRDDRRDDHRRSYFWWHPRPVVVVESRPVYSRRYSVDADVQIALRRRGYYRGPIDGDIGPGTRSAIRAYQYDHGLRPSGYISDSLLRSLGI